MKTRATLSGCAVAVQLLNFGTAVRSRSRGREESSSGAGTGNPQPSGAQAAQERRCGLLRIYLSTADRVGECAQAALAPAGTRLLCQKDLLSSRSKQCELHFSDWELWAILWPKTS